MTIPQPPMTPLERAEHARKTLIADINKMLESDPWDEARIDAACDNRQPFRDEEGWWMPDDCGDYHLACPVCGDPSDYCQGHGELG